MRAKQLAAAARTVLSREGVARTSLRDVAAEGGVPLGTLQYVYPTRELLLRQVIEDLVDQISTIFESSLQSGTGLADTLRLGITDFWTILVSDQDLQIMQYELTTYSLRAPDQQHLARWQYASYTAATARWCRDAADRADEVCAVAFEQLGRLIVASIDGLILQYVCDADDERAAADLAIVIDMVVRVADPRRRPGEPHARQRHN
ncbi:MAG: TetR/AcrR family transcriptional regulator [Gordonia sp. (in: high G+C Gram-positive bacteria)]|uniref:TetR/AcrR family transcriptional regulator n=1 Tax=Gordonia sp. (in: high G+C Gram-positive bacteria) TaxID=84139 RepID=UPI003BB6AFC0